MITEHVESDWRVTDPLQLIATDLATVAEQEAINWLKDYLKRETVDRFVVGVLVKRMWFFGNRTGG